MKLPIGQRVAVGATRLSSTATPFVPGGPTIAKPTASMSTAWPLTDEGSSQLTKGWLCESSVNLYLQSMPVNLDMQATESTCTPNSSMDQNQSEAEIGPEGTRDAAIHAWARNAFDNHSSVAGGPYGDKTPSLYGSPGCCSDDSMIFPATPDASFQVPDFRGLGDRDRPMAESPVPLASEAALAQSGAPAQAAAALAPTPSTTVVLVQVPVQVQYGANTPLKHLPSKVSVAVLSQDMDATTGAVSLELRVVLGPPGMSPESPTSASMPHSQRLLQHSARSASLPRARARPSLVGAEKRDRACRQWNAKGWCKHGDSCRFVHRREQRGAGDAAVEKTVEGCAGIAVDGTPNGRVAGGAVDGAAKLPAQPTRQRRGVRSPCPTGSRAAAR